MDGRASSVTASRRRAGIFLALIVTTKKFRQIGDQFTALTVPQWLGERYGDRRLTVLFAIASLLQITFLVLIVTALVLVLMSVLHISMWVAILIVVVLAFTSILLGGASLHVVSNSVQAMTMLAVAVLLVASGLEIFGGGLGAFFERLDAVAPFYGSMVNPESLLFRDLFEVVVANFVIGVAIIMQPHIISKSLYLRTERDVNVYLVTAMIAGTVFTTVLLVGLYARMDLGAAFAPGSGGGHLYRHLVLAGSHRPGDARVVGRRVLDPRRDHPRPVDDLRQRPLGQCGAQRPEWTRTRFAGDCSAWVGSSWSCWRR